MSFRKISGASSTEMSNLVIVVAGPTASGKTALAVKLAKRFDGEVVGADSMQIYEGMDIATAKPTIDEMQGVKHHLIGFLSPDETFSVAKYKVMCEEALDDIISRGKLPIICGGTGLYIDAVINNTKFLDGETERYRGELEKKAQNEGIEALYDELKRIDPKSASSLKLTDRRRIIRALELYYSTGMTKQQQNEQSHLEKSRYDFLLLGLFPSDRDALYSRIEKRVDEMLEAGLLAEAERFYAEKRSATAVQAIGYKEFKPYLDGEASLEECVLRLKIETRHYAKRQMTWFRRYSDMHVIHLDESYDPAEKAAEIVINKRGW